MARENANYVIGRGKLFIDLYDEDGNFTGERYIGNTPALSTSSDEEVLPHFDSDEGIREQDDEATLETSSALSFTTDDVQPENLAMTFRGTDGMLTQAALVDQSEVRVVQQDRWYQLGQSATSPSGVRELDAVTLTGTGGVIAQPGNYTVDLALGRVEIVKGAPDIADGDEVTFDYGVKESTRSVVISTANRIEGALRFISANPKGAQRDHYWPRCTITPDGEYELKGDDWQDMSFTVNVLRRPGWERHYADGRAVAAVV